MCFVADGYCSVYEPSSIKKSRKAHKCSDCYKVIPVGSSYESVFTVFEGDASTFKICHRCKSLRDGIVLVELAEGCSRHEAEPLLGDMFSQLDGEEIYHDSDNFHYCRKLIGIGRNEDAKWLAQVKHKARMVLVS